MRQQGPTNARGGAQAEEAARLKAEEKRRWWENATATFGGGDGDGDDAAGRAAAKLERMKHGARGALLRCPRCCGHRVRALRGAVVVGVGGATCVVRPRAVRVSHCPAPPAAALGDRYKAWEKWVVAPDDPVTADEAARARAATEKVQNDAFEAANPDFCKDVRGDMARRDAAAKKRTADAEGTLVSCLVLSFGVSILSPGQGLRTRAKRSVCTRGVRTVWCRA